jgi:hypothetical protein
MSFKVVYRVYKKATRLFGGGLLYIDFLFYNHAPPPFEEDIIMTTNPIIIGLATEAITLYTLFFNIKDVCFVNIHPPSYKKNFVSNFLSEP